MLQHTNIDRTDAARDTKAPFMGHCALSLGSSTLTPGAFLSIKVYLTEGMTAPARLNKITTDYIEFADGQGNRIGRVKLSSIHKIFVTDITAYPYLSSCIFNDNNVIMGHITTLLTTPMELLNAAKLAGGAFTPVVDDFLLMPHCHVASFTGSTRAIKVNDTISTSPVLLRTPNKYMCMSRIRPSAEYSGNYIRFDIAKPIIQEGKPNGITKVVINEDPAIDAAGKHLIFRATELSNLRVTLEDNAIMLKGVTDE